MNNSTSGRIWCISMFSSWIIGTYEYYAFEQSFLLVLLFLLISFACIMYAEKIIHDVYRAFYHPSETYVSRCKLTRKCRLLSLFCACVTVLSFGTYYTMGNIYLYEFGLLLLPVLLYVFLQMLAYRKQLRDNIHVRIIHDATELCHCFKWALLSDNQYNSDKTITLSCLFPQYRITTVLRFLKSKFTQHGYRLKLNQDDCYQFVVFKKSATARVSIRATDQEYAYDIEIAQR